MTSRPVSRLSEVPSDAGRGTTSGQPRQPVPAVRWIGEQWSRQSLARVNREWCSVLAASGRVELEACTTEATPPEHRQDGARSALATATEHALERPADVVVRQHWPPSWTAPAEGAWVVVQPWEFGGLPASWLPALRDEVDEVWCYTTHVRDSYARSGVPEDKLQVIPCGVDVDLYRPDGPRYPLSTTATTTLLFVGGTIDRKGIDVLLDAYLTAFTAADDVCLVIKSTGGAEAYRHLSVDVRIRAMAQDRTLPRIELLEADLTDEQMASLYRACDVLVHPYRGEGFALPVAEAMACGLPVVVTAAGACSDFCDDGNAYLLPSRPTTLEMPDMGPSSVGYSWAEPDAAALRAALAEVVADPAGARARGARGRRRIVEDFTWERGAERIAERCEALSGRVPVRSLPSQRASQAPFRLDAAASTAVLLDADWGSGQVDEALTRLAATLVPAAWSGTLVVRVPDGPADDLDAAGRRVEAALARGARPAAVDALDVLVVHDAQDDTRLDHLYRQVRGVLDGGSPGSRARARRLGTPVLALDDLTPTAAPSRTGGPGPASGTAEEPCADWPAEVPATRLRVSYSQNGEDVRAWRALRDVPQLFYVEVGASHPVDDSLTKALSDGGASGVLFEADPRAAEALRQARPRDVVVAAAASAAPGTVTFYDMDVRGWGSVSSERATTAGDHVRAAVSVPAVRVADVLDELAPACVHFMSIDVEGHEEQVLRGCDFERWRPWVLCVEATAPSSRRPTWQAWDHLLTAARYAFVTFDGLNRWYVADEHAHLADRVAEAPLNPFDRLYDGWVTREVAELHAALEQSQQQVRELAGQLTTTAARSRETLEAAESALVRALAQACRHGAHTA